MQFSSPKLGKGACSPKLYKVYKLRLKKKAWNYAFLAHHTQNFLGKGACNPKNQYI